MDITIATLLILGAVLLFVEIFLPGMICGIIGLGCLVAGIAMAYTRYGTSSGSLVLLGVGVALVAGVIAWFKYFPSSRLGQTFVSRGSSADMPSTADGLLNQTGVTHTKLRPSGIAIINGKRVDVVTEGPFLESGTQVKVISTEGMRVVVRAIS